MNKQFIVLSLFTSTLLMVGCGGGGSSSTPSTSTTTTSTTNNTTTTTTPTETVVKVVDGYVIGSTVRDSNGKNATEIGNGEYKFTGAIVYPITATGGVLADTNMPFDITMTAHQGTVLSPITTLIGNGTYSEFMTMLSGATGVNADVSSLGADYIQENNRDMAKVAQMAYAIIKDGLGDELLARVKTTMPNSMASFVQAINGAVDDDSSLTEFQKIIKKGYINNIAAVNLASASDIETSIKTFKTNYDLTGNDDDFDGDGVSNRFEKLFGLDMTNPNDINGSADLDGDGISNQKEMERAFDHCGDGIGLYDTYEKYCNFRYDVALPSIEQPKWEIQVASNGDKIISIKEQYATDNAKKYFSVADSAGSTTAMTFDEANAYCAALEFGGFDDWRLPTNLESSDIFASTSLDTQGRLNVWLFADNLSKPAKYSYYGEVYTWTSTENDSDNADAHYLARTIGGVAIKSTNNSKPKTDKYNAFCVREYK